MRAAFAGRTQWLQQWTVGLSPLSGKGLPKKSGTMTEMRVTRARLLAELDALRRRAAELEARLAAHEAIESTLRESERQFRSVIEQSYDGIRVIDEQGIIRIWNQAAEQITGLKREEVLGRPFWDVQFQLTPDEFKVSGFYERLKAQILAILETGQAPLRPLTDYTIQRPDGIRRILQTTVFPIKTDKGFMVCGISRDVTERRQAEEALWQSQERYALAINAGRVGVWNWDLASGEMHLDPILKAMLGYEDHEIRNHIDDWARLVHPDDSEAVMRVAQEHLDGLTPRYEIEHRMLHRDGSIRWFLARGVALRDERGTPYRMVGTDTDITSRKQAEEALRLSEARYRAIVEDQTELICRWRPDGTLTFVNEAYCRYFGKSRDELIGRSFMPLISEEDIPAVEQYIASLSRENPYVMYEHRVILPHGEVRWQQWTDRAIFDTQGNLVEFQSVGRDISERKEAEAQREKLIEELDAFAHTVAHDLRNPLTIIQGFAETLATNRLSMSEESLRRDLHEIEQQAVKMSNIIDELLLLASVRQADAIAMQPLNMAQIVAEAQRRLTRLIDARRADVVAPEQWPVALGYAPWVEAVWVNYLSNALKYGGASSSAPRVVLGATPQPGGMIRFWVRDNGPGLTPADQARIFAPFTRLDQTGSEGYGVGLSIVRRIVERLGGTVGVESEIGQGSAFSFTLPALDGVDEEPVCE